MVLSAVKVPPPLVYLQNSSTVAVLLCCVGPGRGLPCAPPGCCGCWCALLHTPSHACCGGCSSTGPHARGQGSYCRCVGTGKCLETWRLEVNAQVAQCGYATLAWCACLATTSSDHCLAAVHVKYNSMRLAYTACACQQSS
jgi:hypothetical protein